MGRVLVFAEATFAIVVIEAIKSGLTVLYEGCVKNRRDLVKLVLPEWFHMSLAPRSGETRLRNYLEKP